MNSQWFPAHHHSYSVEGRTDDVLFEQMEVVFEEFTASASRSGSEQNLLQGILGHELET